MTDETQTSINPIRSRVMLVLYCGRVVIRGSRLRTYRSWGEWPSLLAEWQTDGCRMDPLRDDSLIYESVLREDYGVSTKLDVYSGVPHGAPDFFPMLPIAGKALDDMKAGVEWILNQRSS